MFQYGKASLEDLEKIWNKDIQNNINDKRYIKWKEEFINANKNKDIITFVVLDNDDPIGQISLVLNKNNLNVSCKDLLCGPNKANMATFRIEKQYENQGHISKLVKIAEDYAKKLNIKYLTIGVEAKESRTLSIYLHWGYTNFVTSIIDDGELILFYQKEI